MNVNIQRSEDRGHAEHGWLHSRFSFSFADYYNPGKMGFGALRVLNDDIIEPSEGFGTHPHSNMEIITIMLKGVLGHKDSTGNAKTLKEDEIQVMSAGSGIQHSEYNNSKTESLNLLQIWIFTKERNIRPRYDQRYFSPQERKNKLQTVVSGKDIPGALYIHQDAYLSLGDFEKGTSFSYRIEEPENRGVYLFVIDGSVSFNGEYLFKRDAAEISGLKEINIHADENSRILLIDIPL
ncbi:MAG: pirin family protein [Ignavibacteria bacterium]|jgi:redox-sensitive bicupin YhaK (pirin superfamily)|nr:pirin family protein [Ignavibacteria bacterium]MCU7503531.1 pirin family protein [Ignavibacteria bacterium]MCU7517277.1 pirin family protein [Ignavibacteria bacterium]